MNGCDSELDMLRARISGLGAHLDGPWAQKLQAQRHLDLDTAECAYWHSGYHQALSDLLSIITRRDASADSADSSNPLPLAC